MSITTPPPAAASGPTVFDGRSFVPASTPSVEPPSSSDGNDDVVDAPDDDAVPSGNADDGDDGGDDETTDGEDPEPGDAAAPTKSFFDETPEDKRRERFDHQFKRNNELAAKVADYEAKLAKYEAGEGPKPKAPEDQPATPAVEAPAAPLDPEPYIMDVLEAKDPASLNEGQRTIRTLHLEAVNLHTEAVVPARQALTQATDALTALEAELATEHTELKGFERRNALEGRKGMYDTEVEEARANIEKIEMKITRAGQAKVNARLNLQDAEAKYSSKVSVNRGKAVAIAKKEAQKHHDAEAERNASFEYDAENKRLGEVWMKDVNSVIAELKLPAKLHKAAARNAFLEVQEANAARGDMNPVTEAEFKTLIRAALKDMAEVSTTATVESEAELADARDAATRQDAPKKRKAGDGSASKLPSKDEAWANVATVMKSARRRVA